MRKQGVSRYWRTTSWRCTKKSNANMNFLNVLRRNLAVKKCYHEVRLKNILWKNANFRRLIVCIVTRNSYAVKSGITYQHVTKQNWLANTAKDSFQRRTLWYIRTVSAKRTSWLVAAVKQVSKGNIRIFMIASDISKTNKRQCKNK